MEKDKEKKKKKKYRERYVEKEDGFRKKRRESSRDGYR